MPQWGVIHTAVLIIGLTMGGFLVSLPYKLKIANMEAAQAKAIIAAQESVIDVERNQANKTAEVSRDYQNRIAALNKRYAEWVRIDAATRNLPKVPNTPGGHNGTPSGVALSRDIPAISGLMHLADLQTQQLIACQNWIRQQSR